MGARVLSSAILALFGAALIFFGIGFLAWAIWMGLTPLVGEAWAAAITAVLLLLGPVIAFIALGFRRRRTIEERGFPPSVAPAPRSPSLPPWPRTSL